MTIPSTSKWMANSYAKINLGLHVLDRLPGGYHAIETGFAFIEWADRFIVRPSEDTTLKIRGIECPEDESNLILRALRTLETYVDQHLPLSIEVEKKIPLGAGLGGGSSNAATILRMANKIYQLDLSNEHLARIGSELGADIPVFIDGKTAFATGIGTELSFMDIQPDAWILTIYPNIHSSTAEAYAHCEPNPTPDYSLQTLLEEGDVDEWEFLLTNDLEASVFPRYEIIGNIKDQLKDFGALYAAMSGSGSSVFGLFEQDFVALSAYEGFISLGYPTNLTKPKFIPDMRILRMD